MVIINAHACHTAHHHRADDHGAMYLALNTATIVMHFYVSFKLSMLFIVLEKQTKQVLDWATESITSSARLPSGSPVLHVYFPVIVAICRWIASPSMTNRSMKNSSWAMVN
jgi:hypothetical protein